MWICLGIKRSLWMSLGGSLAHHPQWKAVEVAKIFQAVGIKIEEKLTKDGIPVTTNILETSDRECEKMVG